MFKWLKSLFAENTPQPMEDLVVLIQVAQNNEQVKQRLLSLLNQAEEDRKRELERWLLHCEENGAPDDFKKALSLLESNEVAKVALAQLIVREE